MRGLGLGDLIRRVGDGLLGCKKRVLTTNTKKKKKQ